MSRWTDVFLGVIAVATLAMAVVQVALFVATGLVARRLSRLADRVERELGPIVGHLNAISRDAARSAALATAQVERVDRLFADTVRRVDQMLQTIQATLTAPTREWRALVGAFQAGLRVIRDLRHPGRARTEDEDALFI